MKKYKAEFLTFAIGLLSAAFFPYVTAMPASGIAYYVMLAGFVVLVLAFFFFSIAKMRMAMMDFVLSHQILSWPLPHDTQPQKMCSAILQLSVCGGAGLVIFFALVLFGSFTALPAALISVFLVCAAIGLWGMGSKRIAEKSAALPDFVLSHNGLILRQKVTILDGRKNAIFQAALEGVSLKLGLKRGKQQLRLSIPVPEEKIQDVVAFLQDLEHHFAPETEETDHGKE